MYVLKTYLDVNCFVSIKQKACHLIYLSSIDFSFFSALSAVIFRSVVTAFYWGSNNMKSITEDIALQNGNCNKFQIFLN